MPGKPKKEDSPVWDVYDEFRTTRLNIKYYTVLLNTLQQRQNVIDIAIAISAPGSAIAGFVFWNSDLGHWVWQVFAVVAALLAIIKPIIKINDQIDILKEIVSGYAALECDIEILIAEIKQFKKYDKNAVTKLVEILGKKSKLVQKTHVLPNDDQLLTRMEEEVKRELPKDSFYIP
jgi:hypothetical protein